MDVMVLKEDKEIKKLGKLMKPEEVNAFLNKTPEQIKELMYHHSGIIKTKSKNFFGSTAYEEVAERAKAAAKDKRDMVAAHKGSIEDSVIMVEALGVLASFHKINT